MNICIECRTNFEEGIRRSVWHTFCTEACLTQWDTRQQGGQLLYAKLKAAKHGERFPVRSSQETFTIVVVCKYGLRGYSILDSQKKYRSRGMLLDNATLLDWCLHLEEVA